MSNSLINKLHLKKQLFELKMDEGMNVRDHINKSNKCVTQLLSVEVKIDEGDQVIMLLASLPKLNEIVVTMLLVGRKTLTVDEVSTAFLETKILSSHVVCLILDKLLWWILNYIIVGVNHERWIMIEEMIIPNHTCRGIWSVITAIKRDIFEGIVKNWQSN